MFLHTKSLLLKSNLFVIQCFHLIPIPFFFLYIEDPKYAAIPGNPTASIRHCWGRSPEIGRGHGGICRSVELPSCLIVTITYYSLLYSVVVYFFILKCMLYFALHLQSKCSILGYLIIPHSNGGY